MEDTASKIKRELNIYTVISDYVSLTKSGNSYKGLSPFKKEKTPSFFVNEQLQIFKDFSTGKGGDLITFVMEIEGLEFKDALEYIVNKYQLNIDLKRYVQSNKKNDKTLEIVELVAKMYHRFLLKSSNANKGFEYLINNRQLSVDTIKKFKLGYSPSGWNTVYHFLKKEKYTDDEILQSQICITSKRGEIIDFYRDRLMIPLFNQYDKVIGFSARKLDKEGFGPKYINSKDSVHYKKTKYLYGLNFSKTEIKKQDEVLIVEGYFDLISPYQKGVKNIVASAGTALTEGQLKTLTRFTQNIVLLLDNDLAGQEAAMRGIELYQKYDINLFIALLPNQFKDPDEVAIENIEILKESIRNKISYWDFFFYYASNKYDLSDINEKKNAADFLSHKYKLIKHEIIRREYLKKYSEVFGIPITSSIDIIESSISKRNNQNKFHLNQEDASSNSELEMPPLDKTESYFLTLILQIDNTDIYKNLEFHKYIRDPNLQTIAESIENQLGDKNNSKLDIKQILDKISTDIEKKILQNLSMGVNIKDKHIHTEIENIHIKLRNNYYKNILQKLTHDLQVSEKTSDLNKQSQILEEIVKIKSLLTNN